MAERESVSGKERISYEGLLSFGDFLKLLMDWASTKGYGPQEERVIESVKSEGKYVEYWYAFGKKANDYTKLLILIRIFGSDFKDKEVERDGHKQMLVDGRLQVTVEALLETDWENRWETKPIFYFIRTMWDKYVYKPYLSGFRSELTGDVGHLKSQIKAFLNMYKY